MMKRVLASIITLIAVCVHFWSPAPTTSKSRQSLVIAEDSRIRSDKGVSKSKDDVHIQPAKRKAPALSTQRAADEPLLGFDGKLTLRAISKLGFSNSEAVLLQGAIDDLDESLSALARKNTRQVFPESNQSAARTFYNIAPFSKESRAAIDTFTVKVKETFGHEPAGAIVDSLSNSRKFSSVGKYQIVVAFEDFQTGQRSKIMVHFSLVDPETQRSIENSLVSYEDFKSRFGRIFETETTDDN
jgi:hypothetical protein